MDTQNTSALSIHEAAEQGDLERVKWWIEKGGASVNEVTKNDLEATVLHYAAQGGHKQVVAFLLAQGAEVNKPDLLRRTPLVIAIVNRHVNVTQLLLAYGADPNIITSNSRKNCLHLAAEKKGCFTIINQLLQYGASPNAQEYWTLYTPLHIAAMALQSKSIFALYPYADATVRDRHDQTPIDHIIDFIAQDASEEYPEEESIQCLYAFLCAGTEITEAVISTVNADQFPVVKSIIQNAITLKEKVEEQFNYPKPELLLHLLLQSPAERAALLEEKSKLEGLGYHQRSGIHRFLFTPEKERKSFLLCQQLFYNKVSRRSRGRSILDLPSELVQISLEHLLRPASDIEEFKPSLDHEAVTPYASPRPS